MHRVPILLVCAVVAASAQRQPSATPDLARLLSFEISDPFRPPVGWAGSQSAARLDNDIVHTGKASARMERTASSPNEFSVIAKTIAMDFEGRRIEFRGFLRIKDVTGFAGLWMREDGDSQALEFDNMQSRGLKGTRDWEEYSISLRVNPDARLLTFGALIQGTGALWIDGL